MQGSKTHKSTNVVLIDPTHSPVYKALTLRADSAEGGTGRGGEIHHRQWRGVKTYGLFF